MGQGGEAVVYRRGARAVKIYQGLSPDALARKAAKLADYSAGSTARSARAARPRP
jgi:hypothetical protein